MGHCIDFPVQFQCGTLYRLSCSISVWDTVRNVSCSILFAVNFFLTSVVNVPWWPSGGRVNVSWWPSGGRVKVPWWPSCLDRGALINVDAP